MIYVTDGLNLRRIDQHVVIDIDGNRFQLTALFAAGSNGVVGCSQSHQMFSRLRSRKAAAQAKVHSSLGAAMNISIK